MIRFIENGNMRTMMMCTSMMCARFAVPFFDKLS